MEQLGFFVRLSLLHFVLAVFQLFVHAHGGETDFPTEGFFHEEGFPYSPAPVYGKHFRFVGLVDTLHRPEFFFSAYDSGTFHLACIYLVYKDIKSQPNSRKNSLFG